MQDVQGAKQYPDRLVERQVQILAGFNENIVLSVWIVWIQAKRVIAIHQADIARTHDAVDPRRAEAPHPLLAHDLDIDWYVHRHRTEDEVLPWSHLSAGLHQDFLWQDWRDALEELGLEDCRWTPCYDCGACTGYGIEHVVASATPPAGGSQGTGVDLSPGGAIPVTLQARRPVGAAT